ncbi:uncharacterized protein LOC107615747 [Arachis ipaensis]|uniref:uncharacterized protein LOC107615747 n=1 Tax=Arachis ipaensis TaxID=130454 RepID=UPI0007AEEC62|nr:uncharacterized protein LOC107615747 [Arachis ipaensis]
MSDAWTDKRQRSIINFLINSPAGIMFLKSIDASDYVKTGEKLFELLDDVVEEICEQNIVQVVTDNGSNYVLAGGSLQLIKTVEEAQNLIYTMTNNQYFYGHQRQCQPAQRKGVLELEGTDTILAQNKQTAAEREPNTLPSDTIPNPKEECKSIQLSGRTLESNKEATKKPTEGDQANSKEKVTIKEKDQEKLKEKEEHPQASKKGKEVMEEQSQEQRKMVKTHTPPLPYPQRFQKEIKDQQFPKFLEVFKKLEINIPLAKALEQIPLYAKFLKELINKKRSSNEKETVILTQECSAVIQEGIPPKLKDPGSFFLPCTIGNIIIDKALCDLGSSINLMPLSMMRRLSIEEVKPTQMSLELVDRSLVIPNGVIENLLVRVGKFIFPARDGSRNVVMGRPIIYII